MSRLARSLRWLAVTAGLVVMAAGCTLYWLAATESGLRTALGWAADASEGRLLSDTNVPGQRCARMSAFCIRRADGAR